MAGQFVFPRGNVLGWGTVAIQCVHESDEVTLTIEPCLFGDIGEIG